MDVVDICWRELRLSVTVLVTCWWHCFWVPVRAVPFSEQEWRVEFSPPVALRKEVLSQEHVALALLQEIEFTGFLYF